MGEILSKLKLRLGTDLVDKIENTMDKYGKRGVKIGLSGSLIGGGLGYIFGGDFSSTFFGTFFGTAFGINLGYAFGLKYGEHKLNKLKEEFPDLTDDIQEYLDIKMAQTYNNLRPGVKNFMNKKYKDEIN